MTYFIAIYRNGAFKSLHTTDNPTMVPVFIAAAGPEATSEVFEVGNKRKELTVKRILGTLRLGAGMTKLDGVADSVRTAQDRFDTSKAGPLAQTPPPKKRKPLPVGFYFGLHRNLGTGKLYGVDREALCSLMPKGKWFLARAENFELFNGFHSQPFENKDMARAFFAVRAIGEPLFAGPWTLLCGTGDIE